MLFRSSGQLTSRYAGISFRNPQLFPDRTATTPASLLAPPSTNPSPLPPGFTPPPPRSAPPLQRPPLPATTPAPRYMVPDLSARYSGLHISGIPQRASLPYTLDNIWHPMVALGLHTLLPGDSDHDRQAHITNLLRPPIANAPWASSYSLIIPFADAFSMDTMPSPFSTPLSYAGRRDPGGMMNPTFTLTLLSASDISMVSTLNELFILRGPYVASLLDGLDAFSIRVITGYFESLFPNSSFLGLITSLHLSPPPSG